MIRINSSSINGDILTLVHEIQHAIQDIEGFARGGSLEEFAQSQNLFKEANERPELILQADELAKKINTSIKDFIEKAGYFAKEKEFLIGRVEVGRDYVVDIAKDDLMQLNKNVV